MYYNKVLIIDSTENTNIVSAIKQRLVISEALQKTTDPQIGLKIINSENPTLVFINIHELTAADFEALRKIRKSETHIIFISPDFINEHLDRIPEKFTKSAGQTHLNSIQFKIGNFIRNIFIKDIIRMQANSNYTAFFTTKSKYPIITSKSLKYYMDKLDANLFIRPHRSHAINKNFIKSFSLENGRHIILKDDCKIDVSRRRTNEIRRLLAA